MNQVTQKVFLPVAALLALAGALGCDGSKDDDINNGDSDSDGGGASPVDLTPEDCGDTSLTDWEQFMLDKHNEWRASVSPLAADMHRLHWDVNIAQNAAAWVSSCDRSKPQSERLTDIGGYETLGKNLSTCYGQQRFACERNPDVVDRSGQGDGEAWWKERIGYSLLSNSGDGVVEHYMQMVSSNVYAIGCATKRCGAPGPDGWEGGWWWTICQYGPAGQGDSPDHRPYVTGDGGLIELDDSTYELHQGLCRAE